MIWMREGLNEGRITPPPWAVLSLETKGVPVAMAQVGALAPEQMMR